MIDDVTILCIVLRALSSATLHTCDGICRMSGITCNETGSVIKLEFKEFVISRQVSGVTHQPMLSSQLGNLRALKSLFLYRISIHGTVPSELGKLQAITLLSMRANSLTGAIPSELAKLPAIKNIYLAGNSLAGGIPSELGKLRVNVVLYITKNSFEGSIPSELGNIQTLKRLSLDRNSLTGSIPSQLGTLVELEGVNFARNSLEGSIPSELGRLGKVSVLDLSYNYIRGSLPEFLSQLSILILSNNQLTGKLHVWKGVANLSLQVLTLHDNQIGGAVPALTFVDPPIRNWCLAEPTHPFPVFTLHGNHLSCTLPDLKLKVFGQILVDSVITRSSSLMGNSIKGPLPAWVPISERDPILYFSNAQNIKCAAALGISALVFGVTIACTIDVPVRRLVVHALSLRGSFHILSPSFHMLECAVFKMALICLGGVLPTYVAGSFFYECTHPWPNLSWLGNAPAAEWIVGTCFILHYIVAYLGVNQIVTATQALTTTDAVLQKQRQVGLVLPMPWVIITLLFSVPSAVYTITKSLPKENTLKHWWGESIYYRVHFTSLAASTLLLSIALPPIARKYGKKRNVNMTQLMLASRVFGYWGMPVIMTLAMHENCFGAWRLFWCICRKTDPDHDRFNVQVPTRARRFNNTVLKTSQLCNLPSPVSVAGNRQCGRAIVSMLEHVLIFKLSMDVFIVPCLRIWAWKCSCLAPRRLRRSLQDMLLHATISNNIAPELYLWLELSIIWGPLIPVLQPMLLMAFNINLLVYQIGIRWLRAVPDEVGPNIAVSEAACQPVFSRLSVIGFVLTAGISLQAGLWRICLLCIVLVFFCLIGELRLYNVRCRTVLATSGASTIERNSCMELELIAL